MGFWDKVGSSIKEVSKNISEDIKKRQEIKQIKKQILDRFEVNELKKICKDYGIGEPLPHTENPLNGEKYKRVVTREHFIDRIINHLTLDQIKNFCEKNRIKIYDILKDEKITSSKTIVSEKNQDEEAKVTTIEVKRQSEFDSILEEIKDNFEPEDVRDENDFEKQLTQFLKIKYPDKIRRQVDTPKGKIDLVIDNKYAI